MSNGVMAALQILVLSVQVRVLVGQQKTPHGIPCGSFFLPMPSNWQGACGGPPACASRVSYFFSAAFTPTFPNFRQLSDIFQYLHQLTSTFVKTCLFVRSFFRRSTSLLPSFFLVERKNEGRTKEQLRKKDWQKGGVATPLAGTLSGETDAVERDF